MTDWKLIAFTVTALLMGVVLGLAISQHQLETYTESLFDSVTVDNINFDFNETKMVELVMVQIEEQEAQKVKGDIHG